MPTVVERGTCSQEGIGKPDYSKKVVAARQRAGIYLEYNENLVIFGLCFSDQVVHPADYPWVKPPLAAGASMHAINVATGVPMPYGITAGYAITLVEKAVHASEDHEIWGYADGKLVGCFGVFDAGRPVYDNRVLPFTTKVIDPYALSPHTIDTVVVNRSATTPLEGGFDFIGLIERIGTEPPPTTKDCMCPYCSHMQTEKVTATRITCGNCHKVYFVYDLSSIRHT